jgi:hypothetical protein
MGRTATKTTVQNVNAVENMNEEENITTKKTVKAEPLKDTDEIRIESLVANVSYKDSRTGDMYEWDEAGHVEPMTFDVLKNMWRSHKGYFRNMWLKPDDARVINQFGLTKTFEKYEYLMDASNYTKKNIKSVCDAICDTPNGLKFAICDKVKSMVISGEISDVSVIKELEKRLKIDLIDFL